MEQYDCIIIGGGAAGLSAAIALSREHRRVLLIEQCKELGKKLYATGNGRCNFTNSHYDADTYRGDAAFAQRVYQQFPYGNTILFMHSIGVLQQEQDGYYYPYTNQARTVVSAMLAALPEDSVTLCLDRIAHKITRTPDRWYHVVTSYGEFFGRCILLATGGAASPVFSDGRSGYSLARQLGHDSTALYPALCALYSSKAAMFHWKGIRARASVQLVRDPDGSERLGSPSLGQIQLTDYGISGIPVFEVSRYAAQALGDGDKISAQIDFLPEYSKRDLAILLQQAQFAKDTTILQYLCGYLPDHLAKIVCAESGQNASLPITSCSRMQWERLVGCAKRFVLPISKTADFSQAQVTAGGVQTHLIDPDTMESKLSPGCFFAGEMLNVDGTCGGYNLQFAFSSAMVAAKGILSRLEKLEKLQ